MPLIRLIDIEDSKARKRNKKDINLSKTEKMVCLGFLFRRSMIFFFLFFLYFPRLVHYFLLKGKMKAMENAKVVGKSQAI